SDLGVAHALVAAGELALATGRCGVLLSARKGDGNGQPGEGEEGEAAKVPKGGVEEAHNGEKSEKRCGVLGKRLTAETIPWKGYATTVDRARKTRPRSPESASRSQAAVEVCADMKFS